MVDSDQVKDCVERKRKTIKNYPELDAKGVLHCISGRHVKTFLVEFVITHPLTAEYVRTKDLLSLETLTDEDYANRDRSSSAAGYQEKQADEKARSKAALDNFGKVLHRQDDAKLAA